MKSKSIKILLMGAAITSMLSSCGDSWFEREPKNILTNELVWNCLLYTSDAADE